MQQAFLNSLLLTVIIFLGVLATQLLYSLMLSDVDGKTYTFGMLRSLGMKKNRLIGLITLQSVFFSVPGLIGGLLCAFVLNIACRYAMFTISFNATTYELSTACFVLAILFGVIIPMLSNIIPTKKALGKNLRNSLDLNHRAQDGISVK